MTSDPFANDQPNVLREAFLRIRDEEDVHAYPVADWLERAYNGLKDVTGFPAPEHQDAFFCYRVAKTYLAAFSEPETTVLDRIRALHRPSTNTPPPFQPYCVGCHEAGGSDGAPLWADCPTLKILDALGGTHG